MFSSRRFWHVASGCEAFTIELETPVPSSTSENVASMSRVDIPCTYIRAISSASFS